MHRFFTDSHLGENTIIIDDLEQIKQITKVLRLSKGDRLLVFDGSGYEWEAEISQNNKYKIVLKVIKKRKGIDYLFPITLYLALIKKDNFPLVLQKATELGVKKIVPILTKRCVKTSISKSQYTRFNKIIIEAVEQSEGAVLPTLSPLITIQDAFEQIDDKGLNLIAYARENELSLKNIDLNQPISLFIGPEGGFTDQEINNAKKYGIIPLSLGSRILRAETAAIATLGRLIIK